MTHRGGSPRPRNQPVPGTLAAPERSRTVMTTAVLAVLCLYLATCYAYGGYLLVGVLRGKRAAADAAHARTAPETLGPRAGITRAADPPPVAAETPAPRAAA